MRILIALSVLSVLLVSGSALAGERGDGGAYDAPLGSAAALCEEAYSLAEERCDDASQGWIESGLPEDVVGGWDGMYEACMRLLVSPAASGLPAAQHYDLSDGAFWRTTAARGATH